MMKKLRGALRGHSHDVALAGVMFIQVLCPLAAGFSPTPAMAPPAAMAPQEAFLQPLTASPPPPPPPPPMHNGLTGQDQAAILKAHNDERARHGASSLYWDYSASDFADNHLSSCPGMVESGSTEYGENLLGTCCIGYLNIVFNVSKAVESWYNEISGYNFNNPGYSPDTGHFTQIVWKSTKAVGCAVKVCSDAWTYLDCNYYPPGNVFGAFAQNVEYAKS